MDAQLNTDTRWLQLHARKLEIQTVKAFLFFRERGLKPVLIKGWAAARNYPKEIPRFYDDVDLAFSGKEFETAKVALASEEGQKLAVDLHNELKYLDTKPWENILADSELVMLDGCEIRIPAAEDHLRIMAVHWLNDGGARRDKLWDIYYAVANRPADFDWEKCFNEVSEIRAEWIIAAIGLAHRFLGLQIDDLSFADRAKDLPKWLVATVEREWKSGVVHRSLHTCLNDPAEFVRQLRKRFPPNPIQATIGMEGDIRSRWRLPYQLGNMKRRALPSIRGVLQTVIAKSR